jgi:hypothetical protein
MEEINKEIIPDRPEPAAMAPSLPTISAPTSLPFTRQHHSNLLHNVLINRVPPVEEARLVHKSPAKRPIKLTAHTVAQNTSKIY